MYRVHSDYLKTMAAGGVPLSEEGIRERVSLKHEDLDDVRSLCLPGTYEKITHLGKSLKRFIYLKSLDLSRNALSSLEGLQHLRYLEKLNLYFNHISSLSEVLRLQSLIALKEVDLRLNPVVKNESDYRLLVIHMLPNLRRLDDYTVRENERKAALLHFSSDHAYKVKKCLILAKGIDINRCVHPRVEYINALSKKRLMVDENDEAIINCLAKYERDLKKHAKITGSTKSHPEVELYNRKSVYEKEENAEKNRKSELSVPQCVLLPKTWKQERLCKNTLPEKRSILKGKKTDEAQAEMVLTEVQKSLADNQQKYCLSEDQETNKLILEKNILQNHLSEKEEQYNNKIKSLKSELSKSKEDMGILKQHLDKLLKEKERNNCKVEQRVQFADTTDTASLQINKREAHNQLSVDENACLKENQQCFKKMQELTEMLQESQRTLISTNELLLKQLNEVRLQHKTEVEQLHRNYNQLKKRVDMLPPCDINNV